MVMAVATVSHHAHHQPRRLAHDQDQCDRQRTHTRRKPVHNRYTHCVSVLSTSGMYVEVILSNHLR